MKKTTVYNVSEGNPDLVCEVHYPINVLSLVFRGVGGSLDRKHSFATKQDFLEFIKDLQEVANDWKDWDETNGH